MKQRAWIWPVGVACALALHASLCFGALFLASMDRSFAIEPDYYEKAVAWDENRAEQEQSDALGWTIETEISGAATLRGERRIQCVITDRDGGVVEGAAVDVIVFHHARAAERATLRLVEESAGTYGGLAPPNRDGEWELRFTAIRGDDRFTHRRVTWVGMGAHE